MNTKKSIWCGEEFTTQCKVNHRVTCLTCKTPYMLARKKAQVEAIKLGHCLCGLQPCPCDEFKKTRICKCALAHKEQYEK